MVLIDRKALQQRVKTYMRQRDDEEKPIEKHEICDFSLVDGEKSGEEMGLTCNSHYFSYKLENMEDEHEGMDHGKDACGGHKLKTIAQYPFKVSGSQGEPITQLFKLTIGTEFAVGGGMKAILRRTDGVMSTYENLHPFNCLLD